MKTTIPKALPVPVQHAGQDLVLRWGRVTSAARMTPNLLVCGAQRCGTTSMYRALSQHPAILKPVLHKGVHYFDTGYGNGRSWYQAHFPLRRTADRRRAATGMEPATFESSPYYLFHPLAAERIARDLPGVRVITLLRDPAERAYSAHAHESARGYETEPFERALELEDERLAGEEERILADPTYNSFSHQHHGYLHRGHYIGQLERMAAAVGRDRFCVVDAEDFFTDPEKVWREVVRFLDLPGEPLPVFDRHNARPRAPMADSLYRRLLAEFEADDELLAKWWGRLPSWRR
jgi:hypothetical protein